MSPAWVGPLRLETSGLGDTAVSIPAGGGPVREVNRVQLILPDCELS